MHFKGIGFVEAFPSSSHDHFLLSCILPLMSDHSDRHCGSDADQSAGEKPSQCCSFGGICPHMVILYTQFSLRDHLGSILTGLSFIMLYLAPPAGCSVSGQS